MGDEIFTLSAEFKPTSQYCIGEDKGMLVIDSSISFELERHWNVFREGFLNWDPTSLCKPPCNSVHYVYMYVVHRYSTLCVDLYPSVYTYYMYTCTRVHCKYMMDRNACSPEATEDMCL